jgi:dephospho-CoA kinase
MEKKLKIGVTGGIGTGKTTICRVLETMGFPVYYADPEAKRLMHAHEPLVKAISDAFGAQVYENGKLRRDLLAEAIFSDPEKRELLNSLVHPQVREDFIHWTERQQSAIVFQESALLFETGGYRHFDKTILVTAPMDERIARTMSRDDATEEQVRARIANQLPEDQKIPLADFIIVNDGRQLVIPQIEKIVEALKQPQLISS